MDFDKNWILHNDVAIIVLNKPPTLPTQNDKSAGDSLLNLAENYLSTTLFVVHRLDQVASGLVVFAKNKTAAAQLSQQFQDRSTRKIYWTIVEKKEEITEGVLTHFLQHNQQKNKSYVVEPTAKNAKRAELHFILRGSSDRYNLLEINLLTGRHHQIRAQLSAIGSPIKGDVKYGARRSNPDRSIHLHALHLELEHPLSGEKMSFHAAPPSEVLWNFFSKLENIF